MGLLLDISRDNYILLIIISLIFVVSFGIIYILKKTFSNESKMITKNIPRVFSLDLNKQYISKKGYDFLVALHKALPNECVAFPKVGVDNLVNPKHDKLGYNTILSEYVDVCVFLKDKMQPILIIDLYENDNTSKVYDKMSESVLKAMDTVKLPVIKLLVQDEYDITDLRKKVIQAMNAHVVAVIKDNLTK